MISGIYKIISKIDNKYYVGSSTDVFKRWNQHKKSLIRGKHHNDYLQRAWNKHGEKNFDFLIVEEVLNDLFDVERKYLHIAENEQDKSYNLTFYPQGGPQPKHIRQKMKMNHWLKGKSKTLNPQFGKHHSTETRNKIRLKALGRIPSNKDTSIYEFVNIITNERFSGTKEEFAKKTNVLRPSVNALVRGTFYSCKKWSVLKKETPL